MQTTILLTLTSLLLLLFVTTALPVYWLYNPLLLAQPAAPVQSPRPARPNSETGRFKFLCGRDGLPAALDWLQRTQAIYRAAYRDRKQKKIKSYRYEYLLAARDMRALYNQAMKETVCTF